MAIPEHVLAEGPREASTDLITPICDTVDIASLRVREGDIDTLGRQRVSLQVDKRVYRISLVGASAKVDGTLDRLSLASGLFIDGYDVSTPDNIIAFSTLQIPRDASAVEKSSIFHLRDVTAEGFRVLRNDLDAAEIIPNETFDEIQQNYYQQQKAKRPATTPIFIHG